MLGHKLIDVVVIAVVDAVDVVQPSAPACSLTITYSTLREGRHLHTIGIQPLAEAEIFDLVLTGWFSTS